MKFINQIKQMRWWMFLPFGQFVRSNWDWVVAGGDNETVEIRNFLLTMFGLLTTVPTCVWLLSFVMPFK